METSDHLTSGCTILAKNEHNEVCTHLHISIRKKLGNETAQNWYSHTPKAVSEHEQYSGMKGHKETDRS